MTLHQSDELAKALARDGAVSVVDSMLAEAAATKEEPEDRVQAVMWSLEEMAEHRVDAACCLMLSLWPSASGLMMHHVCDGIDLWIDAVRSASVIAHLRHLVESESDPALKRRFEDLLLSIDQKA
jgi:hypothetical protein